MNDQLARDKTDIMNQECQIEGIRFKDTITIEGTLILA